MRGSDLIVGELYNVVKSPSAYEYAHYGKFSKPHKGDVLACTKRVGSDGYSEFEFVSSKRLADPSRTYTCKICVHTCLQPVNADSHGGRPARIRSLESKLKAKEDAYKHALKGVEKAKKKADAHISAISKMKIEIANLKLYASDEEELAAALSAIIATGGDEAAILQLLNNRNKTSLL